MNIGDKNMRLNTNDCRGSYAREGQGSLNVHTNETGARPIGEKYTAGIEPPATFWENKIG